MFILENSITLPRCLNFDDSVTFSWNIRYSFISTKVFFLSQIWAYFVLLCFVLLSTSRIPFICMLDLYFQTFLSVIFSTCFHLLVLLCIFVSFLKTVFHIINFVFGLWIFTSYYFNIFIDSAMILFLSSVSFFNCQLPLSSHCDVLSSYLWSFLVSLLIVVYKFLLCPVLSK